MQRRDTGMVRGTVTWRVVGPGWVSKVAGMPLALPVLVLGADAPAACPVGGHFVLVEVQVQVPSGAVPGADMEPTVPAVRSFAGLGPVRAAQQDSAGSMGTSNVPTKAGTVIPAIVPFPAVFMVMEPLVVSRRRV